MHGTEVTADFSYIQVIALNLAKPSKGLNSSYCIAELHVKSKTKKKQIVFPFFWFLQVKVNRNFSSLLQPQSLSILRWHFWFLFIC